MTSAQAFEKILTLRTTEKDIAYKEYQDSVNAFEAVARKLYNLLKEKEELEEELKKRFDATILIDEIQNYKYYINQLDKEKAILERAVQKARELMEDKQAVLSDSFIEMKKFEKLVDLKHQTYVIEQEKMENRMLDEASIQQFLRQRKR